MSAVIQCLVQRNLPEIIVFQFDFRVYREISDQAHRLFDTLIYCSINLLTNS